MLAIRCQKYRTRTANTMWHLDSKYKFMYQQFITSRCINGLSRKIIWLKCANNNRAYTAYNYFLKAIEEYQYHFQVC